METLLNDYEALILTTEEKNNFDGLLTIENLTRTLKTAFNMK